MHTRPGGALFPRVAYAIACAIACALVTSASAGVLDTREAVIERLYPGATVRSEQLYLNDAERAAVEKRSGYELQAGIIYSYPITVDGKQLATAYLDRHRVRTLPEILMCTIDADGVVVSVDVLSFAEPLEYMPRNNWYALFKTRKLDAELRLGRAIDGVVGATLTTRATTRAVRQALAVHAVVGQR